MSVNATIFAKNAKKCCDFGSLYNIYYDAQQLENEKERNEAFDLLNTIQCYGNNFGLNQQEVLRLIELNRKDCLEDKDDICRNKTYCLNKIENFVNLIGEDVYFASNDMESMYYIFVKAYSKCENSLDRFKILFDKSLDLLYYWYMKKTKLKAKKPQISNKGLENLKKETVKLLSYKALSHLGDAFTHDTMTPYTLARLQSAMDNLEEIINIIDLKE